MQMFQAQIDFYGTEVNVTDILLLSVFTLVHRGQHVVRSIVTTLQGMSRSLLQPVKLQPGVTPVVNH